MNLNDIWKKVIKMSYTIDIISNADQRVSTWSGGTTTELYIYPKGAEYSKRDFGWRLSSAKVDLEESTFTSLPGIWRYIMVMEGQMDLEHSGHHSASLGPYEMDSFSGGWTTKSKGKAVDFNLMLADGYKGSIEGLSVTDEIYIEENPLYESSNIITQAFYCTAGLVEIRIGNLYWVISKGELAIIEMAGAQEKIRLINRDNTSRLIKAAIWKL